MEYKHILVKKDNGLVTITLNRPPLNWLNIAMMEEINQALSGLKDDSGIKLLMFDASGKAFSVGVEVAEHMGGLAEKMIEVFHGMFRLIDQVGVPTLAVVHGSCLGGGCELAIYCDMVLALDNAKFGQPEIAVGVYPPIAALVLPHIIGRKKAMELVLSGDIIDAKTALEIGLVNQVVPVAEKDQAVGKMVNKFLTKSAAVLKLTKKACLTGILSQSHDNLKTIEDIYLNELMKTHDALEGLNSFLEKRNPTWKNC
ncbi:MAG: enoyl-CoA hydratase/isomerase family protein [Deltaproteobacteria bacterium]|nr:enoyl-CoA hydratase/isomerase family protein [Deltaproteobacteria bacterium]MBF0525129.1 enoyl-CoA hydratase/isomerase family protein [Deltaproteobacteria bacterium]